ncbi:Cytochrome P450 [Mycena sanguinolenta]|uniref:Cytochrome P450 n=1 Tax=Mycena sanguinolenta TaxID=230812 RepID=A0A8H6XVX2_9AGAR|nr:Cytochrome P450 [Mycena sanguinolenta]
MAWTATGLFLIAVLVSVRLWDKGRRKQAELPSRGFGTTWATSYLTSTVNVLRAKAEIQALACRYRNQLFTFPLFGEWCVMAASREHVKDHYNAQEEVLSMEAAAEELLQLHHTVGSLFCSETYHIPAIRVSLNLNLAAKLPDLLDEMALAYDEELPVAETWTPLCPSKVYAGIIARASNRIFVGPKLCRNRQYRKLVDGFSNIVITGGAVIRMAVPGFLRPVVGWLFRSVFGHHRRMVQLVAAEIAERQHNRAIGKLHLNPNDMLDWLMDQPWEGRTEHSPESLAMRILNVNFVALHTTTKAGAFTHALYHLASKPEYIPILRSEVESFLDPLNPQSWSKESIARCAKLDSFLKESLRLNGLGAIWMPRLTLSAFEFSDGTVIPPGNFVGTAVTAIHEDEANYARAKEFDGLRFYKLGSSAGAVHDQQDDLKADPDSDLQWQHRLTGTSPSYLTFGGGKHICPGRFFASLELKGLFALLLLRYDVRMADGVRPADKWFGPVSNPDPNAQVLFRRRSEIP